MIYVNVLLISLTQHTHPPDNGWGIRESSADMAIRDKYTSKSVLLPSIFLKYALLTKFKDAQVGN